MENYLLEELVTFAATGTLAKTAQQLNVTQPTVTRGMQKLEETLGVTLFARQPNRITLTATGKLAAAKAADLLHAQADFVTTVQNFDRRQRQLRLGTTVPGPLILLKSPQFKLPPRTQIERHLLAVKQIPDLLSTNQYTLIFSDHEFQSTSVESQYVGTERLAVNLNKFMLQANQTQLSFADVKGLSFIVLSDIGAWRTVIQQALPDAKFLYQQQCMAFAEITKYSDFPYFSSNLSQFDPTLPATTDDNHVQIPLADPSAQMALYASYLKRNHETVAPLLQEIHRVWQND